MVVLRGASLAVALLLELALLAALIAVAVRLDVPWSIRTLVAIVLPLAVVVVWGAFFAPRAARRLDTAPRLVLECVLFGLGAVALAVSGLPVLAIVFAVVTQSTWPAASHFASCSRRDIRRRWRACRRLRACPG